MKNTFFLLSVVFPIIYIAAQIKLSSKAYEQFYTYSHLKDKEKKKSTFIMKHCITAVLTGCSILFMIISLAHPGSPRIRIQVPAEGGSSYSDFSLVFDISNSMSADDNGISRLERVKSSVPGFIYSSSNEARFSVTVFKGSAALLLPLTADKNLLVSVIEKLSPDMFTSSGTAFSEAIETASELFPDHEKTNRHMIIFTDGEESGTKRFKKDINRLSEVLTEEMIDTVIVMPDSRQGELVMNTEHISIPDHNLMNNAADIWGGRIIKISDLSSSYFSASRPFLKTEKDYTVYMLLLSLLFLFSSFIVRRIKL